MRLPHLEEITGAVAVRAIGAFGIDISQLHWDMTSFSLYGAYEQPDEDYPAPSTGTLKTAGPICCRSRRHRRRRDGGIPVYARAYSGGDAEISQVTGQYRPAEDRRGEEVPAGRRLQADQLQQRAAIGGARCTFLAPASKLYVKAAELAACDLGKATEVTYVAGRDQHKKTTSPAS